jgi:hypothetical protein
MNAMQRRHLKRLLKQLLDFLSEVKDVPEDQDTHVDPADQKHAERHNPPLNQQTNRGKEIAGRALAFLFSLALV